MLKPSFTARSYGRIVGDVDGRAVGERFVRAVAAQDARAIEGCFAPGATLRALIPPGLREREGAAEAAALVSGWFADRTELVLDDFTVEVVGDRLHVAYRLHGVEDGEPFVVQQQLYCALGDGVVEHAQLLCSGFRRPDGERAS
jgi:Domain of unknown function (DUF4440)